MFLHQDTYYYLLCLFRKLSYTRSLHSYLGKSSTSLHALSFFAIAASTHPLVNPKDTRHSQQNAGRPRSQIHLSSQHREFSNETRTSFSPPGLSMPGDHAWTNDPQRTQPSTTSKYSFRSIQTCARQPGSLLSHSL